MILKILAHPKLMATLTLIAAIQKVHSEKNIYILKYIDY